MSKRGARKRVIEPSGESGYGWAAANLKGLRTKGQVRTEGNTGLSLRGRRASGKKLFQIGRCRLGGDNAVSERALEIRPVQVQDLEGDEHTDG
jgi:hypothetical protein